MSFIKKEKINNFNFYYYDNEESWQKPVITEQQIFKLFMKYKNIPTNYFAFPWASVCDNMLPQNILKELNEFKIVEKICFTVIQHISFRNCLNIIKKIGITHIFSPHVMIGDDILEKQYDIKIIPFYLFPVQFNENVNSNLDNNQRTYVASFIGQYENYYLTEIRLKIFDEFVKYKDCHIIKRNKWHYFDMVYKSKKITNIEYEYEYKENLKQTIFSLCPSGSGPNSIRIWESMSYGCIPVILADTLILPKIKNINYNDFFIFWKENNIDKLYDYLKILSQDFDKIKKMSITNIELYNKYFSPDSMHKIILDTIY